ncbi:uncharacterized protein LOC113295447 [Papaver somniferum]|uniref:uncharacterized protein LOC113295447 n=1 Tax=Papaver somniferum TaxID=3469 RepID=UPI000E704030|nr:uncharacterized protein LOC113295447 [Papaver somniferum]
MPFAKKKEQWCYIKQTTETGNYPWILLGDLCFHLFDNNNKTSSSIDGWVNKTVVESGLEDIGYVGKNYTWTSNNLGTGSRRSRIVLALGNNDSSRHFPKAKLLHLNQVGSYHAPILLVTNTECEPCWRPFKFFLTWLNDETCSLTIDNAWNISVSGSPGFQLVTKLQSARKELSIWNKQHFGNINQNIDHLQQELNFVQNQMSTF